ncbi:aminopeptidase P family protein [Muribaculaceae bacterium Isolate-002 (NCI)]|nr:aminopeptidase P family protein [Muribaculaceae bacterium Isolate-002 (NCI)]
MNDNKLSLLRPDEALFRIQRVVSQMNACGAGELLIADNADKYYLTGRVFAGWLSVLADGRVHAYVRRPVHLVGDDVTFVRKPEEIPVTADVVGLELSTLSAADYIRLSAMLGSRRVVDASGIMRRARAVKSPYEIEKLSESGRRQDEVYRTIPALYRPGMTDLDLQIEIERALRLAGCLGQFRICGDSMELFMGNILVGDNADNPTPYDFAMGGAGVDPSLPVGADGTVIAPGNSVMVDANGNFNGYMTDMTRTFALGSLTDDAMRAHACSIEICSRLAQSGVPGAKASDLYAEAASMAAEAGLSDFFMGHRQHAGFVGHGVGIEINEAPVIAPRSKDILEKGNVIALEPKFVIPGVGAVGIENTYVVEDNGLRCLTLAPQEILPLDNCAE